MGHFLPFLLLLTTVHCGVWAGNVSLTAESQLGDAANIRAVSEIASQPIAVLPGARLERDSIAAKTQWARRMIEEPFRAKLQGAAWESPALEFIQKAIPEWAHPRDTVDLRPVLEIAQRAVSLGCKDAGILFLRGQITHQRWQFDREAGMLEQRWESFEAAIKHLPGSGYPKAVWAAAALGYRVARLESYHFTKEVDAQIVQWTRESLGDESYRPADAEIFLRELLDAPTEVKDLLRPVVEKSALPEWVKLTMNGDREIAQAWEARGSGFAKEVSEEGWRGFSEHLNRARQVLTLAWEQAPHQPYAASKMLAVEMGLGLEDPWMFRTWFERAIQGQFDYIPAYTSFEYALRPRWHGTHQDMMNFGRACLATKRYDTQVPVEYLRILKTISEDLREWKGVFQAPGVRQEVEELHAALLREPSRIEQRPLRREFMAVDGWLTGNLELVRTALKEAPREWHPAVRSKMAGFGFDGRFLESKIELLSSEGAEAFTNAEVSYNQGDLEKAEPLYREVLGKSPSPEKPSFILGRRLAAIAFEKDFKKGGWLALKPDLATWWPIQGEWKVQPDGTLEIRAASQTGIILAPGRVGSDFELKGEIEIKSAGKCCRTLGVILGYGEESMENWWCCQFRQKGRGPVRAGLTSGFHKGLTGEKNCRLSNNNSFLIQVWKGKLAYSVNGEAFVTDYPVEDALSTEASVPALRWTSGALGFGAWVFCEENTTLIRNLQVRHLSAPPVGTP